MERVDVRCSDYGLPNPFLLKIDVQDGTLPVLRGSEDILPATELVIAEVEIQDIYAQGANCAGVVKWMDDRDFVFYDIIGGVTRPFDAALAQVDLCLAKRRGPLRRAGFR